MDVMTQIESFEDLKENGFSYHVKSERNEIAVYECRLEEH